MLPNKMVEKIKENKEHQTEKYIYKYYDGNVAMKHNCKAFIERFDLKTHEIITVWRDPLEEQEVLPLADVLDEANDDTSVNQSSDIDEAEDAVDKYCRIHHDITEISKLVSYGDQLQQFGQIIAQSIINVKKEFIKIGYCLYEIKEKKLYTLCSCKNIYHYAEYRFNISRGACNEYINIVERFCKKDNQGCVLPELEEKYINYSSSQLALMQRMDDMQLQSVNENMTIREMKDLMKPDDEASVSGTASVKKSTKENLFKIDNKADLFEKIDYLKDLYEDGDKLQEQHCYIEINLVYDQ
ncbi:MAG: hypothetical protein MR409_03215 [Lachnospiraceae bacterium]|nr:hypothetical protein [Lachnospiraceae bacterium]